MNLKVRFKNPVFIFQMAVAIFAPILAYAGLTAADLTTWGALGTLIVDAIKNPYVLLLAGSSLWHALNDPTTAGLGDSVQALTYDSPKKDGD